MKYGFPPLNIGLFQLIPQCVFSIIKYGSALKRQTRQTNIWYKLDLTFELCCMCYYFHLGRVINIMCPILQMKKLKP